jgi:hypothetical protein
MISHDLRLNHRRLSRGRPATARAQGENRPQHRSKRQPDDRGKQFLLEVVHHARLIDFLRQRLGRHLRGGHHRLTGVWRGRRGRGLMCGHWSGGERQRRL